MPRTQTQVRRGRQQEVAETTQPARSAQVLITEFGRISDVEQAQTFASQLTDAEFKALIDWAYERHETEKQAEKDYKAARLLIKAKAELMKDVEPTGDTVDASFSPRTAKVTDAWKVWLRLKARTSWTEGKAKERKAIFNKCFKITGEAVEVLGEDVIEECTESVTDNFAMLKLKRR